MLATAMPAAVPLRNVRRLGCMPITNHLNPV
jgi:hypothetical protein